jgi:hypothetical protein
VALVEAVRFVTVRVVFLGAADDVVVLVVVVVELLSVVAGVASVAGAVVVVVLDDVLSVVGSVGTGWACCARAGVERSAKAAAIAGRALVCA